MVGTLRAGRAGGEQAPGRWLSVVSPLSSGASCFKANLRFPEATGACWFSFPNSATCISPWYLPTCRKTPVDLIFAFSLLEVAGLRNEATELCQNAIIEIWHSSSPLTSNLDIVDIGQAWLLTQER